MDGDYCLRLRVVVKANIAIHVSRVLKKAIKGPIRASLSIPIIMAYAVKGDDELVEAQVEKDLILYFYRNSLCSYRIIPRN